MHKSTRTSWSTIQSPSEGRRARIAVALMLAGLAVAVYLNALHTPFVFDDRTEILENPSIENLRDLTWIFRHSLTRPVTNLSYAVDFAFWDRYPFGYHLTNVLLHAVNVLLLFHLVLSISLRRPIGDVAARRSEEPVRSPAPQLERILVAFTAAGLFAVHPMMTEAVGYVSGRAEVLCMTLFLASVLCLRRSFAGMDRRAVVFLAGLVFFLLALGTKEIAVTIPVVLLAEDLLLIRRTDPGWRRRLWTIHAPLFGFVLLLGAARAWYYITVEHAQAAGFYWRHLLVNLHVLERYLGLLVFPAGQSLVHAVYPFRTLWDVRLLTAFAIVGTAVGVAVLARKREPLITFGMTWFMVVLLPSAALILLASKGQPMAEHRVYAASCGFFIACAGMLSAFLHSDVLAPRQRQGVAVGALTVVLVIFSGLTIARNAVWSDPVRLWEDAARKAPRTWAAQYGVADAYRAAEECEPAVAAYRRAIAVLPSDARAYLGLAECALELDQVGEARNALRLAIRRAPRDVRPRLALAVLEEKLFRRPDEALRLCREALAISPELGEARACVVRNQR